LVGAATDGSGRNTEEQQMSSSTKTTVAGLPALKGQALGVSEWFEVTQDRVNLFADATEDHQWIHVNPERASAESPFGGPVAHGYLTLSLYVPMWKQIMTITDSTMAVNYGLNKVRFPAPVPVGSRIRLSATLVNVEEVSGGALQLTVAGVIEREGSDKPVCVLESVSRVYG
jgi:acyl dehydratase